jgi:hypothetical protein
MKLVAAWPRATLLLRADRIFGKDTELLGVAA